MREVFSRIGSRISFGANGAAVTLICAALLGRRIFVCCALTLAAGFFIARRSAAVETHEVGEEPPSPVAANFSISRDASIFEPPHDYVGSSVPDVTELLEAIHARIVGQRDAVEQIVIALIAGGHALLEGPPGVAKTLACRTVASVCGLTFARIQCNADLSPAEIAGSEIYDPRDQTFRARIGPIAANIVLADEINRAPARAQAAFLEAMEERQVTIGLETLSLPAPFYVLATMNETESDGTFALPRPQLDRFLLKIAIGFPQICDELALLDASPELPITPVRDGVLAAAQSSVKGIYCAQQLKERVVGIVRATREAALNGTLASGAGPRASLALLRAAQGCAAIAGRAYVLPCDVARMAPAVLRHRVTFPREYLMSAAEREAQLRDVLQLSA